jgi:flagellin
LIQTAEGGMQEIDNMVQRIRELVVKAANDTNEVEDGDSTSGDRQKIQDEINALVEEIDSMKSRVEFNGKRLIDGSFDDTKGQGAVTAGGVPPTRAVDGTQLHFQVGANAGQSMTLTIGSVDTAKLGDGTNFIGNGAGSTKDTIFEDIYSALTGGSKGTLSSDAASGNATVTGGLTGMLDVLDGALKVVTTQRSKLGAAQNRLEYTMKSLDISSENLSASESRIRDTDMAKEMMSLTQANVLQQAATSMLAQANQAPQAVLQLLQ